MKRVIILSLFSSLSFAQVGDGKVVSAIEEIDNFRKTLANSITTKTKVDEETFNSVCKPVGGKAKKLAEENGWMFKQISHKNRNENNSVDDDAKKYYDELLAEKESYKKIYQTTINGKSGTRYLYKITVQQTCLHCHGNVDARPDFIKNKYKNDKAHSFNVGDMRGAYSVFVPDKKNE